MSRYVVIGSVAVSLLAVGYAVFTHVRLQGKIDELIRSQRQEEVQRQIDEAVQKRLREIVKRYEPSVRTVADWVGAKIVIENPCTVEEMMLMIEHLAIGYKK